MIIFALVLLGLVLLLGLAALVGGIAGLCLIGKKPVQRKGLATGLLIALMVVGALMTLLPVGFVGFVLLSNFRMDASVVETGIAIEEPGYPGETFTADGVVYELLPVYFDFEYCQDHSEPVFTYTWEDILGNDVPGNLFRVENPQNLDLIWDGCDLLYCPTHEVDEVMVYYSGLEGIHWTYLASTMIESDVWGSIDIAEADLEAIRNLPEYWCSDAQPVELPTDTMELWISAYVNDRIVSEMNFTVALTETDAYLVRREGMLDDEWIQYGIPLADELFSIFESMANAK